MTDTKTPLMDCKDCPHDVGDHYQRDCAFPDCIGGWEEAYNHQVNKVSELERRLAEVTEQRDRLLKIANRHMQHLANRSYHNDLLESEERAYIKQVKESMK